MPNREKVIGHLNDCIEASRMDNTWVFVRKDIVEDAIAMLNEQEADIIDMLSKVLSMLKEQEPVRCKDCAYALFKEGVQPGHVVCTKPFTERWQTVKPDNWFCADGLVKDNCSEFPNS